MITAALVLPYTIRGMIDASATRARRVRGRCPTHPGSRAERFVLRAVRSREGFAIVVGAASPVFWEEAGDG
jgi:hypothetical protein